MSAASRAIVGEPAPRFLCKAVVDGRIKGMNLRRTCRVLSLTRALADISLAAALASSQWTVLIFYPMAWSFICPTEILAFDARRAEFSTRGCHVVFASCDSEHVLKAWSSTPKEEGGLGNVSIPLMSDRNHRLSRDYGVLCEEEGVSQRAVFVIDPRGIIRVANVNDANVGRSVDEIRRMVDALKFVDEFGEGCPVDWRSGDKGLHMSWRNLEEQPEVATAPASARPTLSRGSSWSAGWGRATRPKTWTAPSLSQATTPLQEDDGTSRTVMWMQNQSGSRNASAD